MDTYVINKKRNDVALVTATEARTEFYDWEPVLDVVATQAARIAELEAALEKIGDIAEESQGNYVLDNYNTVPARIRPFKDIERIADEVLATRALLETK